MQELIAYLTATHPLTGTQLRQYLETLLPHYMIPAHYVLLETLPLTANGKLDQSALPDPNRSGLRSNTDYSAPADHIEETLVHIWQQVLGIEPIGTRDNFFERGGHSLKATQVVSRIHNELGVEVSLKQLFMEPEITALARIIRSRKETAYQPFPSALQARHYPLSYAQQRLWILHHMTGAAVAYNIPAAFYLQEEILPDALNSAFRALVQRHESLRTAFIKIDGQPRQKIEPQLDFAVKYIDLTNQSDSRQREQKLADIANLELNTPFHLDRAPLLRVTLVKTAARKHLFLFTLHHIIGDGWSMQVLFRELGLLYQSFSNKEPNPLPPLTIQYKDFAAHQAARDFEAHKTYWLERLTGAPPYLPLPFDTPPQGERDYTGDSRTLFPQADCIAKLRRLAVQKSTTFSTIYLSVFMFFLYWLTKQEDIVIGMGVANRNHKDLENLIGFFVNILPIRIRFNSDMDFEQLIHQVRDACYDAYRFQDYPFDLMIKELNPKRVENRQPMLNVMYEYQSFSDLNLGWSPPDGSSSRRSPQEDSGAGFEFRTGTSKFDITFFVIDHGEAVELQMEYDTRLFRAGTIETFLNYVEKFSIKTAELPAAQNQTEETS